MNHVGFVKSTIYIVNYRSLLFLSLIIVQYVESNECGGGEDKRK